MPSVDLQETLLQDGVRNTNFFNGRLLTAEDLRTEQAANRVQHNLIGHAIGEGIVHGLAVTPANTSGPNPSVLVMSGHALNREGQVLGIPHAVPSVEVTLVRSSKASSFEGTGLFAPCRDEIGVPGGDGGPFQESGRGLYVLLMYPAAELKESVLGVGSESTGLANLCTAKYVTEGVQFRLEAVNVAGGLTTAEAALISGLENLAAATARSRYRNLVAHVCLGTPDIPSFVAHPDEGIDGVVGQTYGPLDALRASNRITECDVPLALIRWTDSGIEFVDMWSVRRAVHVLPSGDDPPFPSTDRRTAESQAAFRQFQDQLNVLTDDPSVADSSLVARDYFEVLPSAGFVPRTLTAFFNGLEIETAELDPAFVRSVVKPAFEVEPIPIGASVETPPPLIVYDVPASDHLLFMRAQDVKVLATEPGPSPEVELGRIVIDVTPSERARELLRVSSGRDAGGVAFPSHTDPLAALAETVKDLFVITVTEAGTGIDYTVRLDQKYFRRLFERTRSVDTLRFVASGLPPASYRVLLKSKRFRSQAASRDVDAGETETVRFTLTPATRTGYTPEARQPSGTMAWGDGGMYGEAYAGGYVLKEYTENGLPADIETEYRLVEGTPTEEWTAWAHETALDILNYHPDAPVSTEEVSVYVKNDYLPGSDPPQDPYAYMVFGRATVHVPVILTASDAPADRKVWMAKSGLVGEDPVALKRLEDTGLADAAVFSNAWGRLAADALGVEPETALSVVAAATRYVESSKDRVELFTGVDKTSAKALESLGYGSSIELANAHPGRLAEELSGALNKEVPLAYAELIVGEARKTVPEKAWSLDQPELNLRESDRKLLAEENVETLGALKKTLETANGRKKVKQTLGVSDAVVTNLADTVSETGEKAAADIEKKKSSRIPVSRAEGVDTEKATAIARKGFGTLGRLAEANVDKIESIIGDRTEAERLIGLARTKLGLQ